MKNDFGNWQSAMGDINSFQRLSGDIHANYDDSKLSWPVTFASGNWGSLNAIGMVAQQITKPIYGDRSNSGDPKSPHFNDQGEMYSKGEFKDVLFYPEDIENHTKRKYHPG